ncbi:hypothetical protein CHS0354_001487 [Potamilus streckersoni]|uniref:Sarcoplasmic reticulum histidine-rich calcium-binding protein n=1 Tax=Potamilus streckersoni TaxID=2493646 RepID=A0AAE0RVD9_9BIVA|nr:hypothetical protein CHS0354_001487 [Potamilus streckersoni]
METRKLILFIVLTLMVFLSAVLSSDEPASNADTKEEQIDEGKLEYAKGSVCGYCSYCKFCKLCDEDCPCETSPTKPNCKMCKYCKFCYLCSALCDTICTPGGILDRVSATIVNSLPSYNKDEVDQDIDSVKTWIDRKKDEL